MIKFFCYIHKEKGKGGAERLGGAKVPSQEKGERMLEKQSRSCKKRRERRLDNGEEERLIADGLL